MSKLWSEDEGSNDEGEVQLTINEHFAKAFEYRKEREELERLKAKYGSDAEESDLEADSESDETEDEDGEELTPQVDAAILRTLARIRNRDPAIYDAQKNIFVEEEDQLAAKTPQLGRTTTKSKEKAKPVTLKQAKLDSILNDSRSPSPEPYLPTHAEEQEALRRETVAALHAAVDAADDDFLVEREKTKDELEREDEDYKAFLEREVGNLRDIVSIHGGSEDEKEVKLEEDTKEKTQKSKKKKTKDSKGKSRAETDQEFLLDYILNRGWIDRSSKHVPTYNEVTSSKKPKKKGKAKAEPQLEALSHSSDEGEQSQEDDDGLLSDSSFDSLADHFEASFNHRFEEPDAATIPSYPRTIASTVRRPDTARKEARERRKERKEEELAKKREEVQRLKALKMRDIKRKLALVGKQGGLKVKGGDDDDGFVDEALKELDLEGEWDPEKHDRQMAGLFDRGADAFEEEEFADGDFDDGAQYEENGKPIWDDDIDLGNIVVDDEDLGESLKQKGKKKKKKKGGKDDQDDMAVDMDDMDADVVNAKDDEEWDGTEEMRKKKLDEYMEELYALEFNDMVGDMPTRFKYVPVKPQNYDLNPVEILLASDKELNEYMSVKKYAPYRQDQNSWAWRNKKQEQLRELKGKLAERAGKSALDISGGSNAQQSGGDKIKKRKGKKERMRMKAIGGAEGDNPPDEDEAQESALSGLPETHDTTKKRKRDDAPEISQKMDTDEEHLTHKKKRRQKKKGDAGDATPQT